MIERSKATPGGLAYGSTGTNTSQHLSVELLKQATGANLVHIPYRGSAPAVVDLLAGQIPLASVDLTSAYPHIQAGRLIALGLADSKRFPVAPEIPTIAEGGVPGFGRASGFIGLFAPAGTPAPVVKKLSREVAAILATPGAQTTARALTSATAYEDDETFARFLTAEVREMETGAVVAEFVELTASRDTCLFQMSFRERRRSGVARNPMTPRPWLRIPGSSLPLGPRAMTSAATSIGETRMPLMSGGDAVVRSVLAHGISTIYCLPGVQSDHLFNAMFDAGDALSVVHTRHEQGAAYMALGAALATGKPAAYSVVPGPGFLNSTAALATAYSTGARVLALIGQIPSRGIGKGHGLLHEIPDQIGILRKLTKWAERVDSAAGGARRHRAARSRHCARDGRGRSAWSSRPTCWRRAPRSRLSSPLPPDGDAAARRGRDRARRRDCWRRPIVR